MGRRKAPLCLIAKGGLAKPIIRHVSEAQVAALKLTQYGWTVLIKESDLPAHTPEDDDGA